MRWTVAAVVPLATVLAGCTPAGQMAVRDTAEQFQAAVRGDDDRAACGLLADEARGSLESASTQPCDRALGALGLPDGAVVSVAVWGDDAQVHLDSGVLFLARYGSGWRITAAGCQPRQDMPYDCAVEA
jgi:hypothetical protein